jgi:hypothetical protein
VGRNQEREEKQGTKSKEDYGFKKQGERQIRKIRGEGRGINGSKERRESRKDSGRESRRLASGWEEGRGQGDASCVKYDEGRGDGREEKEQHCHWRMSPRVCQQIRADNRQQTVDGGQQTKGGEERAPWPPGDPPSSMADDSLP